ncbi:MAG: FecR domain-containing protein, partial [Deltaproteobacteria bacterium]|nr:FecR domain-containing protein [Deltaproteobacteria bacterium]
MRDITCSWVEDHLDEFLAEELSVEREAMVRVHLAVCDSCAESLRLWSGLETAAKQAEIRPLPELIERRLLSGNVPAPIEPAPNTSRRPLVIAISAAVAVAAAIALLLVLPDSTPGASAPDQPRPVADGFPKLVDSPLPNGALLATQPKVANTGRRMIPVSPGTALWLDDDARVSVVALDEIEARFRIERGFAVAEIGPVEPGFRFVVQTPEGEVEARGTVFSVQVGTTGRTKVRVSEGQVEIRHKGRSAEPRVLSAGHETDTAAAVSTTASAEAIAADMAFLFVPIEQPSVAEQSGPEPLVTAGQPVATRETKRDVEPALTDPEPELEDAAEQDQPVLDALDKLADESGHTPESMVKLAQAYRSRRMFSAAARTYDRLVTKFPSSPSAANALVALGQL